MVAFYIIRREEGDIASDGMLLDLSKVIMTHLTLVRGLLSLEVVISQTASASVESLSVGSG